MGGMTSWGRSCGERSRHDGRRAPARKDPGAAGPDPGGAGRELTQIIYRVLEEAGRQEYLPLDRKTALGRELFNAFRKLDLLEEFLEDEEITEIMINGTQSIFLEKKGRLFQSDKGSCPGRSWRM